MQTRIYTFVTGFEVAAQPDAGAPVNPSDVIPLSYLTANYSKKKRVTGTWSAPYAAVAATPIAHGLQADEDECVIFLKSNGGAVDMIANPQIAVGTKAGQRLTMIFTSDADTVFLEDGNGLAMPNGNCRSLAGCQLEFIWDADQSKWRHLIWNNVGSLV